MVFTNNLNTFISEVFRLKIASIWIFRVFKVF